MQSNNIPWSNHIIIILGIFSDIFLAFLQGHIFAADNKYYGYLIPTIGHSVVINILNKLYRSVANFCTDLENHRLSMSNIFVKI